MRFLAIIFILAFVALIGLYVYGQMMEPDTREIEVEANHVAE